MSLEAEIIDKFTNLQKGRAFYLQESNAWVFMFKDGMYGVAIPYDGEKVNERFANVKFYSSNIMFGEKNQSYLLLVSSLFHLRNEFALICADFVEPDYESGISREEILRDPFSWWKKWRELLGNAVKVRQTYSIIGEMFMVKFFLSQKREAKWKPTDYSTYDISSENKAYEVKSTTSKYEEKLTISSQFQLRDPDYLVFCRFEKSDTGYSITDLVNELVSLGMDYSFLNLELEAVGFPEGSLSRQEKYELLAMRKYEVDENFPGKELTEFLKNYDDPFVGKVSYDINLKGISFENIIEEVLPI